MLWYLKFCQAVLLRNSKYPPLRAEDLLVRVALEYFGNGVY